MVEIMWHRRETRRQTEKTNINLNIGRNRSTRLNTTGKPTTMRMTKNEVGQQK
ncbi:MAG: hypothetical protein WAW31_12095 [Smithella sp.]